MGVFFERKGINKRIEKLSYLSYYVCITGIYLLINIPIVMLVSNVFALMFLSLNYSASMKQRLLSVFLVYLILLCSESIVVLLTGHINSALFGKNNYSSISGMIGIQIFSYMMVLIIENYQNVKKGAIIPIVYWLAVLLIPSASLYITVMLLLAAGLANWQILIGIILLLLINVATFYLYDSIIAEMDEKMTHKMLIQQNNNYERQFELMKTALTATRSFRHDLMNHVSILHSLLENNDRERLKEYLSDLMEQKVIKKEYARSGNLVIDSILNFKLQEADNLGVHVTLELSVPEQLAVKSFDMTVILGNLLDNAVHACCLLPEDRKIIKTVIRYDKGRLIVDIKNQYSNTILYENGNIITTNDDKKNHGIGLLNVRNAVEKYQGLLNIEHSDEIFSVTALLFV
jgi:sensor histidine kinase YesM